MPSLMHPLVRELNRTKLQSPSKATVKAIFDAAKEGGVTPTEAKLLGEVLAQKGDGWDGAVRRSWEGRLSRLQVQPEVVRPSKPDSAKAEDLSSSVKVVWTQGFKSPIQRVYVADMVKLAEKYGFRVVLQVAPRAPIEKIAEDLCELTGLSLDEVDERLDIVRADWGFSDWGEDNKIVTNADDIARRVRVLVPPTVDEEVFSAAWAFSQGEGYHPIVPDSYQGAVSDREEHVTAEKLAWRLDRGIKQARGYLEGGNLVPGTLPDGKPYALLGRDSVIISAFHMERTGAFKASEVKKEVRKLERAGKLTDEAIEEVAEKLLLVEHETKSYAPQKVTPRLRREARDFMGKLELTRKAMAKDLGIPASRVIEVTQPEFHIDMHMRPLGPGEVMVNHPRACIELIDRALKDPKIKSWEKGELREMRASAEIDVEERGDLYDQIMAELEEQGLITIPAPGVFDSGRRLANFMNAVPGTTDQGERFFLTTGSTIAPLERAFARFIKSLGVDHVEFVAHNGGSRDYLSAGEGSLEDDGALDCREVHHGGVASVAYDPLEEIE